MQSIIEDSAGELSCAKELEMEEIKKLSSDLNSKKVKMMMKQSSSSAGSNSVSNPSPNQSLQREKDIDPDPKNFPPEVTIKGDVNSSSHLNQIPYVHASI